MAPSTSRGCRSHQATTPRWRDATRNQPERFTARAAAAASKVPKSRVSGTMQLFNRGEGAMTLLDLLDDRAGQHANKTAFQFLNADGTEGPQLTYGELHHRVLVVAAGL